MHVILGPGRIEDKTVAEFLNQALAEGVYRKHMARISDSDLSLATELEKILKDAEKSQDS